MDYVLLFFFFFLILILLVLGLPFNQTSLTNIIDKENAQIVRENFKTSSKSDIQNGASTFYDWSKTKSCSNNNDDSSDDEQGDYIENKYYIQPVQKTQVIKEKADCNSCDISKMKGIDKYVLKSSVPACPDMSKYALKSMVKSCPDMKDYIKKTEIPPCPQCPNLNDYVLKSQIPSQVKCPECPVCPVCPICPPSYEKIEDDPKVKEHIKKYQKDVNKKLDDKYITKDQCKSISNQAYYDGIQQGNKQGETIGEMKGFEKGWEKYQDKINQSKSEPLEEIKSLTLVIKNMLTPTPPITTVPMTTSPMTTVPYQEEQPYITMSPITTSPMTTNPMTMPPTPEEKEVMKKEFLIINPYKNPNKNVDCHSNLYTFNNEIPGSTNEL